MGQTFYFTVNNTWTVSSGKAESGYGNINIPKEYMENWYDDHQLDWNNVHVTGLGSGPHSSHTATAELENGDYYPCALWAGGPNPQCDLQLIVRLNDASGPIVYNKTISDERHLVLYFTYQVGMSDITPTYLETLDKLDQWSSAQYVPYGKSGELLNHL